MSQLDEIIAAWTRTMPAAELLEVLERHGVPAGQIFTAKEMLQDPHYLARDMVLRRLSAQGWDVPMTGVVPRFVDTPGSVRSTGPVLGVHTDTVLRDVALLTDAEIAELREAGLL